MACKYLLECCGGKVNCNALPVRKRIKDKTMCDDPLNFAGLGEVCERWRERTEEWVKDE